MDTSSAKQKKLKVGWFTFSCCEDNTVIFTELLNDHWQEWLPKLEFRHAKVLRTKNIMDDLDVAFVEGAIASAEKEAELKNIRQHAKILVAVGACAVNGMPSAQRNEFPEEIQKEIEFLLERFNYGDKVKRVEDVVRVDERVPGCPMNEQKFIDVINKVLQNNQLT